MVSICSGSELHMHMHKELFETHTRALKSKYNIQLELTHCIWTNESAQRSTEQSWCSVSHSQINERKDVQ